MVRLLLCATLAVPFVKARAQPARPTFEVATVNAVDPEPKSGRFIRMESTNRFIAKNFTLKLLIAAAYNVNPKVISGGPGWVDSAKFDITAVTPGEVRPTREQQMAMLTALLSDRFQLNVHTLPRAFDIYSLSLAKGGPKLKPSDKIATDPSSVVSTVYPDHVLMPARNASMPDFAAVLQRAILDRPVVDNTGLQGRFDFDLEWAPSEREFDGDITIPAASSSPPLVLAMQQQLGLKLEAMHGMAEAIIIDRVSLPSAN